MPRRRIHISAGLSGSPSVISLSDHEAHHMRDVLRLTALTEVELFDDFGHVASGVIEQIDSIGVRVRVESIDQPSLDQLAITVAAAIPKGERADWMIEKLSELGVAYYVPLITTRGIVVPRGNNKIDRWRRIATESAKQSRRSGVMEIHPPIELPLLLSNRQTGEIGFVLSTAPGTRPLIEWSAELEGDVRTLLLFVGPEGGWTDEELKLFDDHQIRAARLTRTILRIETAAIVAAAVLAARGP